MREDRNSNYVPVTVDELMFQFCTKERRKEIKKVRDAHGHELLKKSLCGKTEGDVRHHVHQVFEAWNAMLGDRSAEFSRFKNE